MTIDTLLGNATRSIDLTMYELVDSEIERLLAADAARGVRVRVLLDRPDEEAENAMAFGYLKAHGVAVRWASNRFDLTHEKAAVIDDRTAVVMTLNFTARYYASTRDFAVVDDLPADVGAIERVFTADWSDIPIAAPRGEDLLWSPGATTSLVGVIRGARAKLLVENEEMSDEAVTSALEAAASRGVDVEVVMTAEPSDETVFDALQRAGVHVATFAEDAALYIHAKAIVADPGTSTARAFVGSQNFSVTSLSYNRELGILTSAPSITTPIARAIAADFAAATRWS